MSPSSEIDVAICTKDSQTALASCVSALLTQNKHYAVNLYVSDSSDVPVILDETVMRVFGLANRLTYCHGPCGLVRQRLAALHMCKADVVVMLDDDVLVHTPVTPLIEAVRGRFSPIVMGVKVDAYNDAGYGDWGTFAADNHHFHPGSYGGLRDLPDTSSADMGFCAVDVCSARAKYEKAVAEDLLARYGDAIVDDAVARTLCGERGRYIPSVEATHLGNAKRRWRDNSKKLVVARVSSLLEEASS